MLFLCRSEVNYSRFVIRTGRYLSTLHSDSTIAHQMKRLNEEKKFDQVIQLFDTYTKENNSRLLPSRIVTQALKACTQKGDLKRAKYIHHRLSSSITSDPYISSSLINFYIHSADIETAESLFKNSTTKDLPMYGLMMKGYIQNHQAKKAVNLFHQMKEHNHVIYILLFNACSQIKTKETLDLVKSVSTKMPISYHSNPRLLTSLLDTLMIHEDVKRAEELFEKSVTQCMPICGAMMKGYTRNDIPRKTIELFDQMKKKGILRQVHSDTKSQLLNETSIDGNESSLGIYLLTINALARLYDLPLSEYIVKDIPPSYLSHPHIRNALIDMWGKIGCIDKAKEVYENDDREDSVKYAAMINSYGLNGMGMEAIDLYQQMPQQLIDEVTYVSILNACSHSGLVHQARSIFSNILMKTEKIYTAMIDCLSRAFLFEEAQQLVSQYEQEHSPGPVMYMALISGARNAKNTQLAEELYARMNKLFPQLKDSWVSASVLLANTYTLSGDIGTATDIKIKLAKSGLKKKSGRSWTTTSNGKHYEFRAHDRSHPQSSEIYAEIDRISKQLIAHGHQYDRSWITRPIEADETDETVLCGHSERLAIAWNFVEDPNTKLIRVAKNIRVCGDCHQSTKLIAAIRQCEISVRDSNRIHHFGKDGQCSCNDHY